MCYVITAAGVGVLSENDHLGAEGEGNRDRLGAPGAPTGRSDDERRLARARRDVHVAGWALALELFLGDARPNLRGRAESALSPPLRSTPGGRTPVGPVDLRLPGGRVPHDFLRTDAGGQSVEVERFETVRPDAIVELPAPRIDVMVELDDRMRSGRVSGKLERYDHFLAGWSVQTRRYGGRLDSVPLVVFVCRDRSSARDCTRRADMVLRACRAYAGEYPFDWEYPGREHMLFVSERDMHEGLDRAYGVPLLPPDVRVLAARGDSRAGQVTAEPRQLLPAAPVSSGA